MAAKSAKAKKKAPKAKKKAPKVKAKKKAAKRASIKVPLMCGLPIVAPLKLPKNLGARRTSAILQTHNKWASGTVLHYYFIDRGAALASQMDQVRKGFQHWKDQGIGLEFVEVQSAQEAEIRITFTQGAGSHSYVGTDNLGIAKSKATMNFGWSLTDTDWGWATTLHEIGHALGMPHEHQNPKAGIVWDEPKVLDAYSKPPNKWDAAKTRFNIIRKLPESSISAGSTWDPKSIMHYPIQPGLIKSPAPYTTQGTPRNTKLSPDDVAYIKAFYPPVPKNPPVLETAKQSPISDKVGGQVDFTLKPTETRKYTLETSGEADTRIVLFEKKLGLPSYLSADDDSGEDKNAKIVISLTKGRTYIARVRTNFIKPGQKGGFSVT